MTRRIAIRTAQHWLQWSPRPRPYRQAVRASADAGLVDLIGPDHAICPELKLRPTPGHTPGHVSIAIESRGKRAIVTGDMMHNPIQLERPDDTARFDMDQAMARRTRLDFIDDLANSDVFVIGSHFSDPTGGYRPRQKWVPSRAEAGP